MRKTSFIIMIFYNYVWPIGLDGPASMDVKIPQNGGIFYFQRLLVVYVPTNSFHVADRSFYAKTSGCTDLIYHADLDILWVLVWDSQTQGG